MSAEVFDNEEKYKRSLLLRTFYIGIAVCAVLSLWWFMGKPDIPESIRSLKQPSAEPVKSTTVEEKPAVEPLKPAIESEKAVETVKSQHQEIQSAAQQQKNGSVQTSKKIRGKGVLGVSAGILPKHGKEKTTKRGVVKIASSRDISEVPPILSPLKPTQQSIVEVSKHDPVKEALERAQAEQDVNDAFETYSNVLKKLAQSQ